MIKSKKRILYFILFGLLLVLVYRHSPRRIEFLGYYDKVYAHRVNSLEKLNAALNYFKGVELDLVYNKTKNNLEVNHPPAKTIGLDLETYLSKIPEGDYPFLWLDIKGLDTTNAYSILHKLDSLFEKRNYPKKQILVEALQPKALPAFFNSGYKTSYYLPIGIRDKNKERLTQDLQTIKKILREQPELGISTSYKNYSIIREHFPNKEKYIWALSGTFNLEYKRIRTILEDKTVIVVLSPYRSIFGNR